MKRSAHEALGDAVGRLRKEPYNASSHVRFVVGGREFHAHRWLLEGRTEKYAHALQAGFSESARNEWTLPEHDPDAFEQFLAYLYTDRCDYLNSTKTTPLEHIIALWDLAEEMRFPKLAARCRKQFVEYSEHSAEELLRIARASRFPLAEEAAWLDVDRICRSAKGVASIEAGSARVIRITRNAACGLSFRAIERQLFDEPNELPPSEADMIRFNELFLHAAPLADAFRQIVRAGTNAAVLATVPLYELPLLQMATVNKANPAIGCQEIGAAVLQRARYLQILAQSPRTVSRKPLGWPLEFMPLQAVQLWSMGGGDPEHTPRQLSASTYRIDTTPFQTNPAAFVGDYPSIEFGIETNWRDFTGSSATIELGLMDTSRVAVVTSVVVQATTTSMRVGRTGRWTPLARTPMTLSVKISRPTGIADLPFVASFYRSGVDKPIHEENFSGGLDPTLLLPSVSVIGRLTFCSRGTRWPLDASPFADRTALPEADYPARAPIQAVAKKKPEEEPRSDEESDESFLEASSSSSSSSSEEEEEEEEKDSSSSSSIIAF